MQTLRESERHRVRDVLGSVHCMGFHVTSGFQVSQLKCKFGCLPLICMYFMALCTSQVVQSSQPGFVRCLDFLLTWTNSDNLDRKMVNTHLLLLSPTRLPFHSELKFSITLMISFHSKGGRNGFIVYLNKRSYLFIY